MHLFHLVLSSLGQMKGEDTDAVNDLHYECFISGVADQKVKGFFPSRGGGALTNLG